MAKLNFQHHYSSESHDPYYYADLLHRKIVLSTWVIVNCLINMGDVL